MKKEIFWNIGLLVFAIFLIFIFTNYIAPGTVLPGWHSTSLDSIQPLTKVKAGLFLGIFLIIVRYISLGILSIPNKDLRVLFMTIGLTFPLLILIGSTFFIESKIEEITGMQEFPMEEIKNELEELRKIGMFKAYEDKSVEYIAELAIGRSVSATGGWATSIEIWNNETKELNKLALLRLDTEKVWHRYDTEFIVEGNREYEGVIEELGEISEGHFSPTEIKEEWESKGKIKLSFNANNEKNVIFPYVSNDWADMDGILKYLNSKILDSIDYKFYYGKGADIFVIGLTKKEKMELSESTGIKFEEV